MAQSTLLGDRAVMPASDLWACSPHRRWRLAWFRPVTAVCAAVTIAATTVAAGHPAGRAVSHGPRIGPAVEVSRGCAGQNVETEQAVDYPYVYVTWIGCGGIGFALSTNGGRSGEHSLRVPGSAVPGTLRVGHFFIPRKGWDPAVAVAPDGTVYVSYMVITHHSEHPAVAASTDHGVSFTRVSQVMPQAQAKVSFGDRDFIAVAPDGTVYLTWIYGHDLMKVLSGRGHAYVFIQKSGDGGKTWSSMTPVSPGPLEAAAAPLLVEPGGRIDVLMWTLHHESFTSSANGGRTWSQAVPVARAAGHISPSVVTWIDANIGIDAAGTLYATWDTQRPGGDIGWLSYSTDHGRTWSPARRVTPGHDTAEHIMAVAGTARHRLRRVAEGRPGLRRSLAAAVLAIPARVLGPPRVAVIADPGLARIRKPPRVAGGHNRDLGAARPASHAELGHSRQRHDRPDLGHASAACRTGIST